MSKVQEKQTGWAKYYEKTGLSRPLFVKALKYIKPFSKILDVGAGALGDTQKSLQEGHTVVAVDSNEEFTRLAKKIKEGENASRFSFFSTGIQDYKPEILSFDLINAQNSLPFLKKQEAIKTIVNIYTWLKPGGIFTGTLFGVNDLWVTKEDMSFFTKEEIINILFKELDFEEIKFEEDNSPKKTTEGNTKKSHIFSFILRKKI